MRRGKRSQKLSSTSKLLLDEFDREAQRYGSWLHTAGVEDVQEAKDLYLMARYRLEQHLLTLQGGVAAFIKMRAATRKRGRAAPA